MIFMACRHEHIADLEDQPARTAIADRQTVRAAKPVEHRDTHAKKRDGEPLGGLPSV